MSIDTSLQPDDDWSLGKISITRVLFRVEASALVEDVEQSSIAFLIDIEVATGDVLFNNVGSADVLFKRHAAVIISWRSGDEIEIGHSLVVLLHC